MEEARSVARNGSGRVMPEAMSASRFWGRARPPTARHMQCCLFAIALFVLPVGERMALGAGHAGAGAVNSDLDHVVPMFPTASDGIRQEFVRIINHSPRAGKVHVEAYDDGGTRFAR